MEITKHILSEIVISVELPPAYDDVEARTRAGMWLYSGDEAVRGDSTHGSVRMRID